MAKTNINKFQFLKYANRIQFILTAILQNTTTRNDSVSMGEMDNANTH